MLILITLLQVLEKAFVQPMSNACRQQLKRRLPLDLCAIHPGGQDAFPEARRKVKGKMQLHTKQYITPVNGWVNKQFF